jgi:hypothetical protein
LSNKPSPVCRGEAAPLSPHSRLFNVSSSKVGLVSIPKPEKENKC